MPIASLNHRKGGGAADLRGFMEYLMASRHLGLDSTGSHHRSDMFPRASSFDNSTDSTACKGKTWWTEVDCGIVLCTLSGLSWASKFIGFAGIEPSDERLRVLLSTKCVNQFYNMVYWTGFGIGFRSRYCTEYYSCTFYGETVGIWETPGTNVGKLGSVRSTSRLIGERQPSGSVVSYTKLT